MGRFKIMLKFSKLYQWILVATVLANLMLFWPFSGWPNFFTGIGMVLSLIYLIFFALRIKKMPKSGAKFFLIFLFILLTASFLTFAFYSISTFYSQATNPNLSEDDMASLDWLRPFLFYFSYVMALVIVCLSEAILLRKYPIDVSSANIQDKKIMSPPIVTGIVFMFLWVLDWFFLNLLGYFSFSLLIIAVIIFLVAIIRSGSDANIEL